MGRNTGTGGRLGPVINRTQTYNPKTDQFVKRDETGKFVAAKDTPYKGVRREETAKKQENKPVSEKNETKTKKTK
ncbi:hypothetical protein Klosneuvirus_2_140 [Klosneuvirus KNV1]|uniref:Uncharacterized protein n=1 Tax=Klosneuvirus KNV1 TaxID=1977640 RepID=A0A1V0SJ79_9VIRU|nr:hypothetical protein Klosneuvirus_2_140 [Klosneuvirus KNV1]